MGREWGIACFVMLLTLAMPCDWVAAQPAPDEEAAWKSLAEGSRVTLDLKDATWREAYLKLAEASGNLIDVPAQAAPGEKPVTVHMTNLPFWQAMDEFLQVAPVKFYTRDAQPALKCSWERPGEPYAFQAILGPSRFWLNGFQIEREAELPPSNAHTVDYDPSVAGRPVMRFRMTLEPRVYVAGAAVELSELGDNTGKDLLGGAARSGHVDSNGLACKIDRVIQVAVLLPARNATDIVSMRGKMLLDIYPSAAEPRSKPRRVEYPFAFEHVPLPGLTAAYATAAPAAAEVTAPETPLLPAPAGIHPLEELKAGLVTLDAKEMPLADLLKEISRQTGVPVSFPEGAPNTPRVGRDPIPALSVQYKDAEFWRVMLDLQSRGKLNLYLDMPPDRRGWEVRVICRHPQEPPPAAIPQVVVGPLLIDVGAVSLTAHSVASYSLKPAFKDEIMFRVGGRVWLEPRMLLLRQGASVEECIGDNGADLAQKQGPRQNYFTLVDDPRCKRSAFPGESPSGHAGLFVPVTVGEIPSMIRRLRIYCWATVYDGDVKVDIAKPSEPGTLDAPGGLTASWKLGVENGRNTLALDFQRQGEPTAEDNAALSALRISDTQGQPVQLRRAVSLNGKVISVLGGGAGPVPDKIVLTWPKGLRTHAGFVEFRNLPVPKLPEPVAELK